MARVIPRAIVLVVLLLAAPASAHAAATRYASPSGGTGTCLTEATACSLANAISAADGGDEVVLAPGPYTGLGTISVTKAITVRGGGVGSGRPIVDADTFALSNVDGRVSDLDLRLSGAFALSNGAHADRVIVRSTGTTGCSVAGSTITNSVCTATGAGASALTTQTSGATIRNVTLFGSVGLYVTPGSNPTVTNSAFEGTTTDVALNTTPSTLDHDLWQTESGAGSETRISQTIGRGKYRDKSAGDFVPVAPSLTTDKGINAPAGELDLDGNLRTINNATDIGAYELPPKPAVLAGARTTTTPDGATFAGTASTGGGRATAYFEYGPGFASQTDPQTIPATLESTPVTATLTGLGDAPTPYRLVVTTDGGTTRSGDQVAYRAPTLTASDPTNVTATTATLNGTVALKGAPSGKVEFVYASATSAPQTITGDGPVSQALTGLTPKTTYQWKLRVTRGSESFETPVGTFTTAAAGTPTGTVTPTPTGEATASPTASPTPAATPATPTFTAGGASARRKAGRLLLSRRSLTVSFQCGDAACSAKASGTVSIGRKRYGILAAPKKALRLEAGEKGQITLTANKRLVRRVVRYLKKHPKAFAKVKLKGAFVDADGTKITKTIIIKVRRPK